MTKLVKQLQEKLDQHAIANKTTRQKVEAKYQKVFSKQALFMGNGIYTIAGQFSSDTRELFLMFVAQQEQVPFDKN